jgi:hypothetical protein
MDSFLSNDILIHQPTMSRVVRYNSAGEVTGIITDNHLVVHSDSDKENDEIEAEYTQEVNLQWRGESRVLPLRSSLDVLRCSRPRSIKKTSESEELQIHADEDCREPVRRSQAFYGSNVPALATLSNVQEQFSYQLIHQVTRKLSSDLEHDGFLSAEETNELMTLRPHLQMPLKQQITGYYEWTCLEDAMDVLKWIESKSYHRSWSENQREGFTSLLRHMEKASLGAARLYRRTNFRRPDDSGKALDRALDQLGITNIRIHSPRRYFYHFTPRGEDMPRHRRTNFNKGDQARIDCEWPQYWLPGEEAPEPEPLEVDYIPGLGAQRLWTVTSDTIADAEEEAAELNAIAEFKTRVIEGKENCAMDFLSE